MSDAPAVGTASARERASEVRRADLTCVADVVRDDFVARTVDRTPYQQGGPRPETHIPIHAAEALRAAQPDSGLILPWNLKDENTAQLDHVRRRGGRFMGPIPEVRMFD